MIDSERELIPMGWQISEIGKEIEISGGSTPSTSEKAYWTGKHYCQKICRKLNTERKIIDEGLNVIGSRKYPEGVILMSSRAPIGYLALSKVSTAVNQGIIAMVCNIRLSNYYMLNWCRANMEDIKNRANGTTFLEISKSNFRYMKIIVPPARLIHKFDSIAGALYALIAVNLRQSNTLTAIRKFLYHSSFQVEDR